MAGWPRSTAATLIATALAWTLPVSAAQRALEYEVKAAYLSNFLKFVEWPTDALGAPGTPFGVCVVGIDPFGQVLDGTLRGESVSGHPVVIRRMTEPLEFAGCRVVFLGGEQGARRVRAVRSTAPRALLVGEASPFLTEGGHINFLIVAGHVRFDINFDSAKDSGLLVSSKLARVARNAIGAPAGRQ